MQLEPTRAPAATPSAPSIAAIPHIAPAPSGESRLIVDPRPIATKPSLREALHAAETKLDTWLTKASAPPSVQLAVIFEGRLVYANAFGMKNLETGEASSLDTLYSINSMSKSLTCAAVMQLVEAGKVSLDARVVDLLPEFATVSGDPATVASVTLRELLSHTSRISRDAALGYWDPGRFWDRQAWPTWSEVANALPKARVLANPAKGVKYSNLGLMLAGEIVSRVSGVPYEQYVKAHITEPLGMHDTHFTLDDAQLARCAAGYEAPVAKGAVTERGAVPLLRTPGAMGPASGCRSTATDVARWVGFLRDPSSTASVLTPSSVATMRKTVAIDDSQDQQFGLGLVTLSLKAGTRAFGHTGSGMGFASVMRMTTDGSLGVIALTNDWSLQQNRVVDVVMAELVDVARKSSPKGAPPKDPAWAELMGGYLRGGGLTRQITTNASGDLTIDKTVLLTPVAGKADTFVMSGDARTGENDEELFFLRHPVTGAVTHALVGGTEVEAAQRIYRRL